MLNCDLGDMSQSRYHDRFQLTIEFSCEVVIHVKLSIFQYALQN